MLELPLGYLTLRELENDYKILKRANARGILSADGTAWLKVLQDFLDNLVEASNETL